MVLNLAAAARAGASSPTCARPRSPAAITGARPRPRGSDHRRPTSATGGGHRRERADLVLDIARRGARRRQLTNMGRCGERRPAR